MTSKPLSRRKFTAQVACAALLAHGTSALAQSTAKPATSTKVPAELGVFGGGAPWQVQGSGALRFFGFKAYDANLWTTGPAPASSNPFAAKSLYALEIIYNTGIKAEEIVNVSLVEMARLRRLTDAQVKAWTAEMQRTFPSVVSGDRLTGLHVPNVGTRFFFNARLISEINESAFSDAFFAIWLDEGTKRPELRRQLLGQT
jgi:Chalcone isomerase-like